MTTCTPVSLHVTLRFESGLHIGTGFGIAKLLDERTMQGPHPKTIGGTIPYVPGSSLKGRLRAKATSLVATLFPSEDEETCKARNEMIIDLFGAHLTPESPPRPGERRAGRLVFADAHLSEQDAVTITEHKGALLPYLALERRTHVALSRERRSAKEDMLMTIEVASPGLHLETMIEGWLPAAQAMRETALLVLAICATTHLGGHKGRGLGAVQMVPTRIRVGNEDVSLDTLREAL
ncbi:MAG: hypothetical protein HC884_05970 [Chloroflexaceae bacterium]|nr:hypothetical protein [Chloroflexaceae bacterium]